MSWAIEQVQNDQTYWGFLQEAAEMKHCAVSVNDIHITVSRKVDLSIFNLDIKTISIVKS